MVLLASCWRWRITHPRVLRIWRRAEYQSQEVDESVVNLLECVLHVVVVEVNAGRDGRRGYAALAAAS